MRNDREGDIVNQLWKRLCDPEHLRRGWKRVEERRGSPGIDRVSIVDFKSELDSNLAHLAEEIGTETYQPLPSLQLTLYERGKERVIGIFGVRDRVVQQALQLLLQEVFEPEMADSCHGYRPGRSATTAAEQVETWLRKGKTWLFETDIKNFFDNIDHAILLNFLRQKISDERLIRLVKICLEGEEKAGARVETNYLGTSQGSALSPLLSNIYLSPLDHGLLKAQLACVRYSDDLIILTDSQDEAVRARALCQTILLTLNLELKEAKTRIGPVAEGFDFLGFHFGPNGRVASVHAIAALEDKLDGIATNAAIYGSEEALDLAEKALLGWKNYFSGEPAVDISNPVIFTAILKLVAAGRWLLEKEELANYRARMKIEDSYLLLVMMGLWYELGYPELALLECARLLETGEYEDYCQSQLGKMLSDKLSLNEIMPVLIQVARAGSNDEYQESIVVLIELLCEFGSFALASRLQEQVRFLQVSEPIASQPYLNSKPEEVNSEKSCLETFPTASENKWSVEDLDMLMELFSGREGIYARQVRRENGSVTYEPVYQPIDDELWCKHLDGQQTIGLYLVRNNLTVKVVVIDVDVSKKELLASQNDTQERDRLLRRAHRDAVRLLQTAGDYGVNGYIEDSGNRGRHCWFFFAEPVISNRAREFAHLLAKRTGQPSPGITWEVFPGAVKLKPGQAGPLVKLPLGIHLRSGKRSCFMGENGQLVDDPMSFLRKVKKISLAQLENILVQEQKEIPVPTSMDGNKLLDQAGGQVKKVVEGCAVVKYLVGKAESANYLSHRERIILLQTLGLLGDEGKDFLRLVMRCCVNYDRKITEKYLGRVLPKPISCARIREDMIHISASLNCDCRFRRGPKVYPTPVLYAQVSPGTTPRKTNKPQVVSDAGPSSKPGIDNISKPADIFGQEIDNLVEKMNRLRQHQQGVEKGIQRCEYRLNQIFDQLHTEQVNTKLGRLVRETVDGRIVWSIRL